MCQCQRQVHVRTKSTKQVTKSSTHTQSASRSCDGANASRSRTPTVQPLISPPVNDPPPSVLATGWVEAPVKHRPGARSHQLVRHCRTRRVQLTSTCRREGPYLELQFSGELYKLGILQTNVPMSTPDACPDPEHKSKPQKAPHQPVSITLL